MLIKKITPSQNRHKPFLNERISGIKKDQAVGKYNNLEMERKPRKFVITNDYIDNPTNNSSQLKIRFKNLKHPLEKFKDKESRKLIQEIFQEYKQSNKFNKDTYNYKVHTTTFDYESLCSAIFELARITNKPSGGIFKNKGEGYHVFLPLDGMSPGGYFYKGALEQLAPKARVTFLITPYVSVSTPYGENNLKRNLLKSLNKQDKHFVVIDCMGSKRETINGISRVLSDIYKKRINVDGVFSPEFDHDTSIDNNILDNAGMRDHKRDRHKDIYGSNSIPISEAYKVEAIKEGVFDHKHQEIYKRLKKDELVKKYTFYYLGNAFMYDAVKYYSKYLLE
jgi:hypothetical protein